MVGCCVLFCLLCFVLFVLFALFCLFCLLCFVCFVLFVLFCLFCLLCFVCFVLFVLFVLFCCNTLSNFGLLLKIEAHIDPFDHSQRIYSPLNFRLIKKTKKSKIVPITTIILPKINL